MIDTGITIKLYSFEELGAIAQQKAIHEHRRFMLDIMQPSDFISGEDKYDTPEQLQAQYNAEWDYVAENDEPVIESIEANEYLFYDSGDLAHIVYKFPNGTRETWLKMNGLEYQIA